MTDSALELEQEIEASVILMGSFQDAKKANDIDLIIIYKKYDRVALRKIKELISIELKHEFGLPIHFTTLSYSEYIEMEKLHAERHQIIFDANCLLM
jgi:predicted nucleotidyltransferase